MTARRWLTAGVAVALVLAASVLAPVDSTVAAPRPRTADKTNVDPTLGNGLGRLLAQTSAPPRRASGGLRMNQSALAIEDRAGRVLVDLTPRPGVDRTTFRQQAVAAGLVVTATDPQHGTLEGFVALAGVRALAALPGTGALAQSLRPRTRIGAATSQGVALERADRVQARGLDGRGVTIAALSDSYDTAATTVTGEPLTVHAAQDVATDDLPGAGNARHPQPVQVLEDDADQLDEGRAMLQVAHDVAPAARLCFATATTGIVGFADNVRKLADRTGRCGADVMVDDIGYYSEPMFSDSVVSDAIDTVAQQGVHYFSAAGNNGEQQAWASRARLLPAAGALKGTNLDFSQVDPALYTGGLQDMDPGAGTDVAQTVTLGPDGGTLDLQWDDPVDVNGPTLSAPYFTASGTLSDARPTAQFGFTPTRAELGRTVQFRTDAVPSGDTDLVLSVTAPDGSSLGTVDAGISPEVLIAPLSETGHYTITVSGFLGATGPFTVDVRGFSSAVSTDYNLLLFDLDGSYVGALADRNQLTGQPSEIGFMVGLPGLQLVVARAGTGPVGATRLRNVLDGDIHFSEYADPLAPAVYGHPAAAGATAVAAYDPFRPFLPESFTSPGGDLPVEFDSAGHRYAEPQTRRVPQVAGADGGNTTFFTEDTPQDRDSQPNFFGTSAAAPHAAAIAALVLQHTGGPRTLTPTALRRRLEGSTFLHDLDPDHAGGAAAGLSISADGPQGDETETVPGPIDDPRFFSLRYDGRVPLRSVTFYGESASPTALGVRRPPLSDGIVFDPRRFGGQAPFLDVGYPFTVGATGGGLAASTVQATYDVPAGTSSGQYRRLTLTFGKGLSAGQSLKFGVDRDLAVSGFGVDDGGRGADRGNGADELGGATFLPSGLPDPIGLAFVATRTDGSKIPGVLLNRLGRGYSVLDGYGLVNAERAVFGR